MRALSDAADRALQALWDDDSALIAVGGYGRAELSPRSDLDILIIHRGKRAPEAAVKRLLYELWDGGFEVGHSTRTVAGALKIAASDLDAATAYLDARLVVGDERLFEEMSHGAVARARKEGKRFAQRLYDATRARYAANGDVPFLLEPNIKDGAGGLRDRSVHRWLARVFQDVEPPEEHAEVILRIRNLLHERAQRHLDVLLFSHQDPIAAELGYTGERPGDALMRDLYAAAREVWWSARAALRAARGEAAGRPRVIEDAEPRRALVSALRTGSFDELYELDREGLLERWIPQWKNVQSLPQRNIYHRFTVDVHCFQAVVEMVALGSDREEPIAARVWSDIADRDRALLAALLHDAGKGAGDNHSIRGEQIAVEALASLGFGSIAAAEVGWLVGNHLLLAETAARRDLGDQRLIEDLAARIGTPERAKMLYVLTVADARATGPEAWTPWKSTLVAELFLKIMRALARSDVTGAEADELIRRRTHEAGLAMSEEGASILNTHLAAMPRSYLLAYPSPALIRHFSLVRAPLSRDDIRLNAIPSGEPGTFEVAFALRDRPGVVGILAGALTVGGMNIVTADAFTREDGVAVDVFRVSADALTFEERKQRVLDAAARAIRGDVDLHHEIEQRRSGFTATYKGKAEPPRVVVDNTSSDFSTIVEVHASDRPGLLYDVARALSDLGLTIDVARIATYGHDVVDVFYVRELDGRKATRIDQIERDVLARV